MNLKDSCSPEPQYMMREDTLSKVNDLAEQKVKCQQLQKEIASGSKPIQHGPKNRKSQELGHQHSKDCS